MKCMLWIALLLSPVLASASTINVNCNLSSPAGKINNMLKVLNPSGPNTLVISGTCKENVIIQGFDRLTLIAKPGAAITDASGGQAGAVVAIDDSRRISIQGFTISGGQVGLSCNDYSLCRLSGNTFQGNSQRGVDINDSDATFSGDIIQNNPGVGIYANDAHVQGWNVTIQGSDTGLLAFTSTVVGTQWNVSNNGDGIFVGTGNFQLINSTVTGNRRNGITATDLADLSLEGDTVAGNSADGVYLGDLAVAWFDGGSYTGNAFADIGCGGQYAVAKNLAATLYGYTNCSLPPAAATAQVRTK